MTVRMIKKKPGPSLSRSEIVTVRLDPKLRYLADLAARKQRRTVSSFIEWAIERGLDSVRLSSSGEGPTMWDEADALWDVDEADRFVKLALLHPELLTHDEQVLWKLVRENGYCWRGRYNHQNEWSWVPSLDAALIDRIRDHWETFNQAAAGNPEAKAQLPTWAKTKPEGPAGVKGKFDDIEDDIPF
jgi:hypothetical protein